MIAPVVATAQDVLHWLGGQVALTADLCLDSRQVTSGDVFFACPGRRSDGREHIGQALEVGAGAVVVHVDDARDVAQAFEAIAPQLGARAPVLFVTGLAALLGQVGDGWYGEPSRELTVIAVTGTNGKTSTVQWLARALGADNVPCGTIGTLGVTLPDGCNLGGMLTTPDVLSMHRSLAALRDAGAVAAAIEASSIGIEQGRLDAVRIAFAGFTNLTHDHLDYHLTPERYKAAKLALFSHPELQGTILNLDDPVGQALFLAAEPARRIGFSLRGDDSAGLQANELQVSGQGQVFQMTLPDGKAQLVTPMPGEHNVANLLLVAGMLHLMGWPLQRVVRALAALRPVPGRLQVVTRQGGDTSATMPAGATSADAGEAPAAALAPMVVVDYAHTPDALERALRALRATAQAASGRLICVFGCGGDRDPGKRPMMGRIAVELADRAIVTSDNPRTEDPLAILAQIIDGLPLPPLVVPQRAQAILRAILDARPGDVVLLAGKGHETYQEVGQVRRPFDDSEWARLALAWRDARGFSTDSRKIGAGELFVALSGDTFDGHQYLAQVQAAGAAGAIVSRRDPEVGLAQFVVGDTREALAQLAAAWRARFELPVIAVTGSNGKTTTKEMVAAILRAWAGDASVLSTRGNLNNDIGVPLTVLGLTPEHRAAVIELGMNHPGEIAGLAAVAQATVALVTNAQREHQEFMGSVKAVALENGAALQALPPGGVAVYPGDEEYAGVWDGLAGSRPRLRFGLDSAYEIYADDVSLQPEGATFRLHVPGGVADVSLAVPGRHNVRNALAAAACAHAVGVPLDLIARGLAAFRAVGGRLRATTLRGMQLIDDTYNANPDSVRAAIDVLAGLPGRRTLVLGDMGEVGADSQAMHAEVGAYAADRGIQVLLTLGQDSSHAAEAFGAGAAAFQDIAPLAASLAGQAEPSHILVKGSRFMRMERVVQQLQAHDAQQENQGE